VKNVVALSVSLVVALTAAYLTWTKDPEEVSAEAVAIWDTREGEVTRLAYHTDKIDVVVDRRTDAAGDYFWVDSTETKIKPKKHKKDPHGDHEGPEDESAKGDKAKGDKAKGDKAKGDKAKGDKAKSDGAEAEEAEPVDAPEEPEEPDEQEIVHESFLASVAAEDLWKAVAPLLAMRELEAPSDPSVFGLDAPRGKLTVTRGSGPIELELGGETYGAKDRYVRFGGKVFLVDDAKLKPLESAGSKLMERALFPSEQKEIERLEVTLPAGGGVVWTQVNKDDAAKAAWARKETPGVADDVGATWITKLLGLKLQAYVAPDAADAPTSLEPMFTYGVVEGEATWEVQVLRTTSEPWSYYAKSEYNRSLVKLQESTARNVVDDLDTLAPAAP
jgi:hypothetical protein